VGVVIGGKGRWIRLFLRTLLSATLIQRQALLAHRTQIPHDSLWVHLPPDLRRCACATASLRRLHPPALPDERKQELLDGLDVQSG